MHVNYKSILYYIYAVARSPAEYVAVYDRTVEEGKSMQFACDRNAVSPFYYYRYHSKNMNPPIIIAETQEEWPWQVYAINMSNSPSNLRIFPSFLARSDQPWQINNFTVEFNNNIICCQGYTGLWNNQNISLPSVMICYSVNVQCK